MNSALIRLTISSVVLTGASLAFALSTGPPASRTGAPSIGGVSAEATCNVCHTGFPLNQAGATLEILGVPESYQADMVYDLHVRMTSTFPVPRRWGFEITAVREADGQGAGTFDVAGATLVQVVNGAGSYATRRYVEHTSAGTFDNDPGPVEWTFQWRAPDSNLGRIIFFCAGNAANSNSTTSGDHIYTVSDTAEFAPPLNVTPVAEPLSVLGAAHPNPFADATTLSFVLSAGGPVDLSLFDAQGRRVRALVIGDRPAGRMSATWDGRRDDGARAGAGVYFVRLLAPGASRPLVRRITLAR